MNIIYFQQMHFKKVPTHLHIIFSTIQLYEYAFRFSSIKKLRRLQMAEAHFLSIRVHFLNTVLLSNRYLLRDVRFTILQK